MYYQCLQALSMTHEPQTLLLFRCTASAAAAGQSKLLPVQLLVSRHTEQSLNPLLHLRNRS